MVLSAAELAQARADMAAPLPDTCTLLRVERVPSDDPYNPGWSEVETQTSTACRLGPVSGRERVLGGQVVEESDAVVTLPADVTVSGADRITHDGRTYEVVDVPERSEALVQRVFVRAS